MALEEATDVATSATIVAEERYDEGACSGLAMWPSVGQAGANEPIVIYEGQIDLVENGTSYRELGRVLHGFIPSSRVSFEIPSPTRYYGQGDDYQILIPGADDPVKVLFTSAGMTIGQDGGFHRAEGLLQTPLSFGSKERIGRVRFHLVNFRNCRGSNIVRVDESSKSTWPGRVTFEFGPWRVTLDSVPHLEKKLREAKGEGGYVLTHVGNLEQRQLKNGIPKLFGVKEANRALQILYYIFTFVNGSRCGCVLPCGYRTQEVTRCAEPLKTDRAEFNWSWFADGAAVRCFAFAERIFELWKNEDDRGWLVHAISLYADSNRNVSGADVELAKSQIALELLAWEINQEQKFLVSRDTFEHMPAADKLRLVLLWAGIPTGIPSPLSELGKAMKVLQDSDSKGQPADGPFAITQLRNAVTHANRAKRKRLATLGSGAHFEAWQLSQQYVELLLLRMLDYRGPFSPRIKMQQEAQPRLWIDVPWISS